MIIFWKCGQINLLSESKENRNCPGAWLFVVLSWESSAWPLAFGASAAPATRLAAACKHASVRAQAARWLGVHGKPAGLAPLLKDSSALVRRNAVESAARFWGDPAAKSLIEAVFGLGSTADRRLRHAVIASLAHLDPEGLPKAKTACLLYTSDAADE